MKANDDLSSARLRGEAHRLAPSSADWTLAEVVPIFSVCAMCLGVGTTVLGPWAERAGPRKASDVVRP